MKSSNQRPIDVFNGADLVWYLISDHTWYLSFFYTAKFLENKIYTEKRQFFALDL